MIPASLAMAVQVAIYSMDVSALLKKLGDFLLHTVSYFDTTNETFYHGWMLPLDKRLPGILIELKSAKDSTEEHLEELAKSALDQIKNRQYSVELEAFGVREILTYGIAFSGKQVRVETERCNI